MGKRLRSKLTLAMGRRVSGRPNLKTPQSQSPMKRQQFPPHSLELP
jgi:hypothetical protein